MSRHRTPHRLSESRRGPPHGELLNADGTTTRLDGRGLPLSEHSAGRTPRPESAPSEMFVDGQGRVVDEHGDVLEAQLEGSDAPVTLVVAGAGREREAPRRTGPTPAEAAADGRAFARAGMTPARLERAQAREQRTAAPAPSQHPDLSTRDGQSMARAGMTPEQIARLERRDRLRRG